MIQINDFPYNVPGFRVRNWKDLPVTEKRPGLYQIRKFPFL